MVDRVLARKQPTTRQHHALLASGPPPDAQKLQQIGGQHGVTLPGGWLFPGQNPVNHLTTRQLSRIFHTAKDAAEIDKLVSLHTLRHCFATHLLEQKVDIRVIQVLLGHKKLDTTAHYSQVDSSTLKAVKSPLEQLAVIKKKTTS